MGRMNEVSSCAVYIDGDGIPFWLMEQAVESVRQQVEHVTVKAYKDWTQPAGQRLIDSLWGLGATLVQVTQQAKLKNGTDIAMVVDAVDDFHSSPSDAVALLGNDSDFTALALYLSTRTSLYGVTELATLPNPS
jgi:hypothetical protein